ERFLRFWHEVNFANIGFDFTDRIQAKKSGLKWFPYQKGGEYRKWYGNLDYVVNWFDDGREIQNFTDEKSGKVRSHNYNLDFIFKKGITWNALSSSKTSARVSESSLFDNAGSSLFVNNEDLYLPVLAFINSDIIISLIKAISPTLNYQPGDISKLPAFFDEKMIESLSLNTAELISLAKENWSQQENSYQFSFNQDAFQNGSLVNILKNQTEVFYQKLIKTHELECDNNKIFYEKCNILNENNLALAEITLENNVFQSLSSISKDEYNQFKAIQVINSLSLAIGCMMGRYSLDREGLVYAHEGNKGFSELVDEGAYQTFPADEDGILPLMDSDWFDDDVTSRVKEFVRTVWGEEHLQENLDFIAESLCLYAIKPKKGESSLDTIRRYLSTQFWKDHMKMYKKRPIYWLFSSGKEKAFECLVYLHRYNEGTLSRMRTEYVVPLLARYQGNIDLVNDQLKNAESGAATTRLKKELDGLTKKFNELRNFDDRLRHYADRRITIDLDDGVKVNYGKFGDLLADVKAITGSAPQEA
ncbi:TPA: BREX-1 system adenine-specific DNA-methyltransferase PglX, partial [Escherichia coli]|nr:BREX-1 system adenine-specific DNA-methyltransferase PglX [Escherichia coli]